MNLARFEQIKKKTADYDSLVKELDLVAPTMPARTLEGLGDIFQMLQECVAELNTRFNPVPIKRTGPKPVILDAKGQPVLPPPMVQQFEGERRDQYAFDRHMAVMSLDPDQWRVFSLRWGLAPPPGGWENTEAITNVMHAVRLGVRSVPYLDKHFSAVHLTSRGIKLPPGITLRDGVLYGHDTDESLPTE